MQSPLLSSHLYEKSPFSCPVIENVIWIEHFVRGHLSYKAIFSLSQRWPLNTGLTVYNYVSNSVKKNYDKQIILPIIRFHHKWVYICSLWFVFLGYQLNIAEKQCRFANIQLNLTIINLYCMSCSLGID